MAKEDKEEKQEEKLEIPEDNAEVLAYLSGEAGDPAPEPGDVKPGFVANRGDTEEAPFPSVVTSVESAGYVTVYNRLTGAPSVVNANMLGQALKKRYPSMRDAATPEPNAGKLVFTLYDPGIRPPKGKFKCYLHADDPRRAEWNKMGLPVCPAGNLVSAYHRDRHLSKKHKDEAGLIADLDRRTREAEKKQIENEDREERKALMRAIASLSGPEVPVEVESTEGPETK